MNKNNTALIVIVIIAVAGIGLLTYPKIKSRMNTSQLRPFASCLKEKGASFYGTFWCPYCQKQKEMFGAAADELPYVECSSADGKRQLQTCADKKIEGYPTWIFADASRLTGVVPLEELAEKTGCALPDEQTNNK